VPELRDRANLEAQFASRIAALNGRQRQELEHYLTLTDPPSARNVPPEAWDRWEKEHRDTLLALLLLVWITSAQEHGTTSATEAQSEGIAWAFGRANAASADWARAGRDMLAKAGADWDAKSLDWQSKIAQARKTAAERFGVPGIPSFEHGPLSPGILDELGIPKQPVNRQEVFDRAANIFGPSRAEAEAVTEFTRAQTAGGEWSVGKTVGISEDDLWGTIGGSGREDSRVCPVCHRLNGTKRSFWSRFFPDGPPAHRWCRCELRHANVRGFALAGVGESIREAFDSAKHPRDDHGRFISSPSIKAAQSDPTKATELRKKVTDPQERRKLDAALGQKRPAAHRKAASKPATATTHRAVLARTASEYHIPNPEGHDTQSRFRGADGHYTKQRQELHRAIISTLAEGAKPSREPTVLMTGGGSASGKGSLLSSGVFGRLEQAMHIDSDHIKAHLPEYHEALKANNAAAAAFVHEESSDVSAGAIAHGAHQGFNMVYDSVGDGGIEKLAKKIGQLRAGGHKIVAHYVTVDTEEAVRRSHARGQKSGRFVPEEHIRNLHASVSRVVPEAIKRGLYDHLTVWDNNGREPQKIATAHGKKLTIHDPAAWQRFLDKAK
jgi:predicted ABC-type ATPase